MLRENDKNPAISPDDAVLLRSFLDAMWSERGLSAHTQAAYGTDLRTIAMRIVSSSTNALSTMSFCVFDNVHGLFDVANATKTGASIL